MELIKELDEYMSELEELKIENKRLIARVQEQNSNINLLNNEIRKNKKDITTYKRLYENEKNEKNRLFKLLNEKQERLSF